MTREIMLSNSGSAGPLPGSVIGRDMPITSVTLETKDLKHANAYINFTCNVNLPANTGVNLIFIIKKYCDKGMSQEIGGSFVFAAESDDDLASKMFAFQFIDKDIHPGKYTYSIQLASNSVCNCNGGTTVTNAVLNVLAIGEGKDDGKGNGGKGGNGNSGNNGNGGNGGNGNSGNNGNSADANSNANDTNSENAENTANSVDAAETNAEAKSDRKESKDKKEKEHKDDKDSKDKNEKDKDNKDNKDKKEKDNKKKDCKEKKNKDK